MCTSIAEPDSLLKIVNNGEKAGNLAFLDINIKVNSKKQYNCKWCKKPTDRGLS